MAHEMHQQAILITPADADFMIYRGPVRWEAFTRMNGGSLDQIASCTSLGIRMLGAGIAAAEHSLFDATAGHFVCGSLEQLQRGK